MPAAPQIPRLLRSIDELDAPLVQVWGWPGSGRATVLAALLGRDGARGLAPADLASETAARKAVGRAVREQASARGRGLLVCPGLPRSSDGPAILGSLAEAVPAGWTLVVATAERRPVPGTLDALVTPRELALRPDEAAALWQAETGRALSAAERSRLVRLSDGWWRVLVLAAAGAAASGAGPPASGAALVAVPEVAELLRLEVLSALSDDERVALAAPSGAPEEVVRRLRDDLGLLLEEADGTLRPPAPLAALLARRARDGRPAGGRARRRRGSRAEPARAGAGPPGNAASYRLRLLGHPEVEHQADDETWRPVRFTLKRGLRMLAYLATSAERSALREELIEALWPEDDREVIERNFHPTLSHLRRDLRGGAAAGTSRAELLVFHDGLYSLDPMVEWWIDADELVRLVEAGEAQAADGRDAEAVERWEAAWRLYRGPLLDGVYDRWAARRRERIQRRHLALLRNLGATYERLGRADQALDAYRALLVDDPLEEKIHVALMRLYATRGRRDLVRRQYERLSLLLRTELGIEPMPETAEEYHRLMIERG